MAGEIEVRVDWCDYVFDKNYELMTLEEREKYLQMNKHLPYIASGKDIEQNGANLGQAVVGILHNTEDLTLYIIELSKKVESLLKENEELKKQINYILSVNH